jgi:hypothetical protein
MGSHSLLFSIHDHHRPAAQHQPCAVAACGCFALLLGLGVIKLRRRPLTARTTHHTHNTPRYTSNKYEQKHPPSILCPSSSSSSSATTTLVFPPLPSSPRQHHSGAHDKPRQTSTNHDDKDGQDCANRCPTSDRRDIKRTIPFLNATLWSGI